MTIISIFITVAVTAIITLVATYRVINRRNAHKYQGRLNEALYQLGKTPAFTDDCDAYQTYRDIELYTARVYMSKWCIGGGNRWSVEARSDQQLAIVAWIRSIHAVGLKIRLEDTGSNDCESNPQQTDRQIERDYKALYNRTFQQMTGMTFDEYEHFER